MTYIPPSAGPGGGAPTDATYILQTADGDLSAAVALSSLATGLLKVTTTTGALTTAAAGTDYPSPSTTPSFAQALARSCGA